VFAQKKLVAMTFEVTHVYIYTHTHYTSSHEKGAESGAGKTGQDIKL
jgi:hypothetical protein